MAASCVQPGPPIEETRALARRWTAWVRTTPAADLGEGLIGIRETGIDSLEAVFAEGVRRFDQSGEYAADGALGIVPWLRWKCKLSKGAAHERVIIGRQLEQLPATQKAFATGDLGYQHVAGIAQTAEQVGAAEVRKSEAALVERAGTMDPGQFTGFLKSYEHQVDAEKALADAQPRAPAPLSPYQRAEPRAGSRRRRAR